MKIGTGTPLLIADNLCKKWTIQNARTFKTIFMGSLKTSMKRKIKEKPQDGDPASIYKKVS